MPKHSQEMMAHRHMKNCAECKKKRYVTGLGLCVKCGKNREILARHRANKAKPVASTSGPSPAEKKAKKPSVTAKDLAERAKIDWACRLILLGSGGFTTAERQAFKFMEDAENKPYIRGVLLDGENVVVELERQPLKLSTKKFVPRVAPEKKTKKEKNDSSIACTE